MTRSKAILSIALGVLISGVALIDVVWLITDGSRGLNLAYAQEDTDGDIITDEELFEDIVEDDIVIEEDDPGDPSLPDDATSPERPNDTGPSPTPRT